MALVGKRIMLGYFGDGVARLGFATAAVLSIILPLPRYF